MSHALLSIGVAGSLGAEKIAQIAPVVEAHGFHALWVNDTPGADSLAGLASAARTTQHLTLATGVVPVACRPAGEIAAALGDLPRERLVVGIGSGGAPRPAHWTSCATPLRSFAARAREWSSAPSAPRCDGSGRRRPMACC
ncbi:LLM class flavin-dependent oxidoreductase [Microbacterium aurum]